MRQMLNRCAECSTPRNEALPMRGTNRSAQKPALRRPTICYAMWPSMLGPGGFDPARDIAGITVNRWPHGYAYSVDAKSGDVAWWPEYWRHERRPWVDARQSIGNIAIAGTDASSNAMTESAIEEAHRAVQSLAAADTV